MEIGIPEEIVPILQKAGYNMVSSLAGQNPQKVQQQIGEIIKKFKLTVEKPSVQALAECIAKVEAPAPES